MRKNRKKLKILTFLFIFCAFFANFDKITYFASAENQKTYFAKIESDKCYFYSSPTDSEENKLFKLPYSYFVKLTEKANDEFYEANFEEISGYVKKSDFIAVDGAPNEPYPYLEMELFYNFPLYLRPSTSSVKLADLTTSSKLYLLGDMEGEYLSISSNCWHYVSYSYEDSVYYGYIYSAFCEKYSIKLNLENFEKITYEIFTQSPATIVNNSLSLTAKIFIIIGISLPCFAILYLLIKPNKVIEKTQKVHKKSKEAKLKKRRASDYFEFDENSL